MISNWPTLYIFQKLAITYASRKTWHAFVNFNEICTNLTEFDMRVYIYLTNCTFLLQWLSISIKFKKNYFAKNLFWQNILYVKQNHKRNSYFLHFILWSFFTSQRSKKINFFVTKSQFKMR